MTSRREQFRAIFLATVMVVSMVAMGATALAGSAAADPSSQEVEANFDGDLSASFDVDGENAEILAGSAEQDLPRLELEDNDVGGVLSGDIEITLPDELSFDTDEDPTITATGDVSFEDDRFEFENDGQTLVISVDDSSSDGDTVRVTDLAVEATPDIDADFEGEILEAEITTGHVTGTDDFDLFDAHLNEMTDQNGGATVPADGSSALDETITIDTATPADPATGETFDTNPNFPVDEGTDITIVANETDGISFDTSETDVDDIADDLSDEAPPFDVDEISVSDQELTLPVNETFEFDERYDIIGDNIEIEAAPDATDDSELEMTYEATNSTGVVEASSEYEISVINPDFEIFSDNIDLAAGVHGQEIDESFDADDLDGIDNSLDTQFGVTPTDDDGQIEEGQNVTLVMNSTDVTFAEENKELEIIHLYNGGSEQGSVSDIIDVKIDEDAGESHLTFEVTDDFGEIDEGEEINRDEAFIIEETESLDFNVSSEAEDEELVGFEVLTGEDDEVVSEPEADNLLEVDTIDINADLPDSTDEIFVDGAGADGYPLELDIDTPTMTDGSTNVIDDGTNLTVELEPTADYEFDTREEFSSEVSEVNDDFEGVDVESNTLEFELDTAFVGNDDFDLFDDGAMNFSSGVADADISVTTNSTADETPRVETTTTETFDAVDVQIDDIGAVEDRAGFDNFELADEEDFGTADADDAQTVHTIVANETVDGGFGANDLWAYGGADVDLEVEEHPDGADDFDQDLLNDTTIETAPLDAEGDDVSDAEWGYAAFNFTGTVAGDYSINATVDNSHVLINYTVEAGEQAAVNVEKEENGFKGLATDNLDDSDQTQRTGIYNVSVEDGFGNIDESGELDFEVVSDDRVHVIADDIDDGVPQNQEAGNFDRSEDLAGDDVSVSYTDSSFYVVAEATSAGESDLTVNPVGDDAGVDENTGTVEFFESAEDAEFELNELEDGVTELTVEPLTDDGDVTEIPYIEADISVDNDTVADFEGDDEITEETNTDGQITANITDQEIGETEITVDFASGTASDGDVDIDDIEFDFEVEDEPPADFQIDTFDDVEIVEGDETDVEVTIENDGGQDGEQIVTLDVEDVDEVEQDVEIDEGETEDVTFEDVATDDLDPDTYDMEVETEDDSAEAELEVLADAADLSVTLDDLEIDEGDTTDIDVEIDNDGVADADDVSVELDIDEGEITVDETVDVDSDDSATVTFEDVATDDLDADEYEMEATATHDDDDASDTATLTVEEEDDEGIPGFTAGIAALALLGAALLALRLRNEE